MKGIKSLALLIGFSLIAVSQASAQSNGKLYAYANPLPGPLKFADHTWVTDYQSRPACPNPAPDYWYSTGACHPSESDGPPRLLSSADADVRIAKCIAKPNVRTFWPGPATAGILYGFDGVCHQIANRILAATGGHGQAPVTVAGAHGYKISRFVYGVYGTRSQWANLRKECKVSAGPALKASDDLALMAKAARLQAKTALIQKEQSLLRSKIAQIRRHAKMAKTESRTVATELNDVINASLRNLASSLGAEGFQRLFDWPAEQPIVLVDPEVASQVKYGGE